MVQALARNLAEHQNQARAQRELAVPLEVARLGKPLHPSFFLVILYFEGDFQPEFWVFKPRLMNANPFYVA